jgi:hypothetical protein
VQEAKKEKKKNNNVTSRAGRVAQVGLAKQRPRTSKKKKYNLILLNFLNLPKVYPGAFP